MSKFITVDLADTVGPLRMRPELRVPRWENPLPGCELSSLVTPGACHVDLLHSQESTDLDEVLEKLKLWWEWSIVLVLEGAVRHEWESRTKNALTVGWDQIFSNQLLVVPPLGKRTEYLPEHKKRDRHHPFKVSLMPESIVLLASPGKSAGQLPLTLSLEGCIEHLHVRRIPSRLLDVPELHAHAISHQTHGSTVAGIYDHDSALDASFTGGMVSLAMLSPEEDEEDTAPNFRDLILYPPRVQAHIPGDHHWSCDVMFR